jgi:hypothetical protein
MAKATHYSDQKNWSNNYLTDPKLIKALGRFDLDPACPPKMPWRTARHMWTEKEDGLKREWRGRVWLNPPYRNVMEWTEKLAAHEPGGCALLNGRSTETRATQHLLQNCAGLYLFLGRLTFWRTDGKPFPQRWFPSLLIGMKQRDAAEMVELPGRGFPGTYLVGPRYRDEDSS